MNEMTEWQQKLSDAFSERTLNLTDEGPGQTEVSELIPYLKPGMDVLDIGCGPGSITLDVAATVAPGRVVGRDINESYIELAGRLAKERSLSNASFAVGSVFDLDFPDDTFDLSYSHTVLHSLIDPMKTLQEQRRVVKTGGWVIASGVRDIGFSPRYPECPTIEEVYDAFMRYHDSMQERYLSGEPVPGARERQLTELFYLDAQAGRKCPEWFTKAGLVDLNLQVKVFKVDYPGADPMEPSFLDYLPGKDEPDHPFLDIYRDIMAEGLLDQATYDRARQELVDWYQRPFGFRFWALVFIAGRA
jgi:ubiquinone/menaquinone biosynthesis C-methylase UbiE